MFSALYTVKQLHGGVSPFLSQRGVKKLFEDNALHTASIELANLLV